MGFFYDLHRSFCNSVYIFCARNSKVCCEKEIHLSDLRVRKRESLSLTADSLPSDYLTMDLTTFLQCDVYQFRFMVLFISIFPSSSTLVIS